MGVGIGDVSFRDGVEFLLAFFPLRSSLLGSFLFPHIGVVPQLL